MFRGARAFGSGAAGLADAEAGGEDAFFLAVVFGDTPFFRLPEAGVRGRADERWDGDLAMHERMA